jgi:hypothetical protein
MRWNVSTTKLYINILFILFILFNIIIITLFLKKHAEAVFDDSTFTMFEKVKKKYAICIICVSLTNFPETSFGFYVPTTIMELGVYYQYGKTKWSSVVHDYFTCLHLVGQTGSSSHQTDTGHIAQTPLISVDSSSHHLPVICTPLTCPS